jgi:hypothetical protein
VSGDGCVTIEYAAAKSRCGCWYPRIWVNGRERGEWHGAGYSRNEALARAKRDATEERLRFVGDWTVTMSERAALRTAPAGEATK